MNSPTCSEILIQHRWTKQNILLPTFLSGINDTAAEINGAKSAWISSSHRRILNNWSKDISQALKNRGVLLNQNLSQLKESIEKGVKELQLWFLNDSYDELSKFWEKVDSALEKPIEARKPLLESIDQDFSVDGNNAQLMVLSLDQLLDRENRTQKLIINPSENEVDVRIYG